MLTKLGRCARFGTRLAETGPRCGMRRTEQTHHNAAISRLWTRAIDTKRAGGGLLSRGSQVRFLAGVLDLADLPTGRCARFGTRISPFPRLGGGE